MRIDNCLMSFQEMVEQLQKQGVENWPRVLLPKNLSPSAISDNDLNEKLRDTWWEVAWSSDVQNESPRCLYLADSLPDALRRRPHIHIAADSHLLCTAEELFELMAPWQDEEDEMEPYWFD